MANFAETLKERQGQWNKIKSAFATFESKYNDLTTIVKSSNQFVQDEFKRFDSANNITSSYNKLKETFDNYTVNVVNIDNTSDWDTIQEYVDDFDTARNALESAISSFRG